MAGGVTVDAATGVGVDVDVGVGVGVGVGGVAIGAVATTDGFGAKTPTGEAAGGCETACDTGSDTAKQVVASVTKIPKTKRANWFPCITNPKYQ